MWKHQHVTHVCRNLALIPVSRTSCDFVRSQQSSDKTLPTIKPCRVCSWVFIRHLLYFYWIALKMVSQSEWIIGTLYVQNMYLDSFWPTSLLVKSAGFWIQAVNVFLYVLLLLFPNGDEYRAKVLYYYVRWVSNQPLARVFTDIHTKSFNRLSLH